MKKLAALNPKWIAPNNWATEEPFYIGVSFLCPHCTFEFCPTCGHGTGQRLVVMFYPPIDPEGLVGRMFDWPNYPPGKNHTRVSGTSFDDLTILPSIGFESIGHWHGTITNGVCEP